MRSAGMILLFLYLAVSIFFLLSVKKAQKREKRFLLLSGILFAVGVATLAVAAFTDSLRIFASGFLLPLAVFLVLLARHTREKYKRCSLPVSAVCVDFREYLPYRTPFVYRIPKFRYTYGETTHTVFSFVSYPRRKFLKLFTVGSTYTVYIDPHTPTNCIDKRKVPRADLLVLLPALLFFGIAFLVIFSPK